MLRPTDVQGLTPNVHGARQSVRKALDTVGVQRNDPIGARHHEIVPCGMSPPGAVCVPDDGAIDIHPQIIGARIPEQDAVALACHIAIAEPKFKNGVICSLVGVIEVPPPIDREIPWQLQVGRSVCGQIVETTEQSSIEPKQGPGSVGHHVGVACWQPILLDRLGHGEST